MKLIKGDCVEWLSNCKGIKTIFMDPPDNLDLDYVGFLDYNPNYIPWLRDIIWLSQLKADIVWVSYNSIHDFALTRAINLQPGWRIRKIIWAYTFCQYNDRDLAHSYRPIILMKRDGVETFPGYIREESERMRLGDARAAGPKVPSDVWHFPRVVGNSPERQGWHPTQHPVALYDRIMKYSGGPFVDLFAGSGTCFRAGLLNPDLEITGIELSGVYCDRLIRMKNVEY